MKFCVAYMNYFDNELVQKIVEAENFFDAAIRAGFASEEDRDSCSTYDEMQQYFFDGDMAVSVIEI